MAADTVERLRSLMAEAAALPGRTVAIPPDLAAEVSAELAARSRPAVEAIRQREYMPHRDGVEVCEHCGAIEANGEAHGPRCPTRGVGGPLAGQPSEGSDA